MSGCSSISEPFVGNRYMLSSQATKVYWSSSIPAGVVVNRAVTGVGQSIVPTLVCSLNKCKHGVFSGATAKYREFSKCSEVRCEMVEPGCRSDGCFQAVHTLSADAMHELSSLGLYRRISGCVGWIKCTKLSRSPTMIVLSPTIMSMGGHQHTNLRFCGYECLLQGNQLRSAR